MADTYLTLQQLENAFQVQTLKMLGYDATPDPVTHIPANSDKVRISWPVVGAPAFSITQDVCFLKVSDVDHPYNKLRDISYPITTTNQVNSMQRVAKFTNVHKIQWILYGPNSYDAAQKIRNGIYLPENVKAFKANNLFLTGEVPAVMRNPEPFNNQWWERSDFEVCYNQKITRKADQPYLVGISDVNIVKGR